MPDNCLMCQKPLKQPTRGRKRVYCGSVCRRVRERILARLRRILWRLLERFERYSTPGNSWGAYQMPFLLPKLENARKALDIELAR